VRIVAGEQQVGLTVRQPAHAFGVHLLGRETVDAQAQHTGAPARSAPEQLGEQRGFTVGAAQNHACERDRFGDVGESRRRPVVEQRDEDRALRDVGQQVHRRRHAEVEKQERIVALGFGAYVREQLRAAQPFVDQRDRGAAPAEDGVLVGDAIRRAHAEPQHRKRLRQVGARIEEIRVGRLVGRRGRQHGEVESFERQMRREGERVAFLASA
jgi:hypothetical protein